MALWTYKNTPYEEAPSLINNVNKTNIYLKSTAKKKLKESVNFGTHGNLYRKTIHYVVP